MPTHQDYPWERDARKRAERRRSHGAPRKRPLERPGVVCGVLVVAGLVLVLQRPAGPDPVDFVGPSAQVAPAAPVPATPPPSFTPDTTRRPTPRVAGSVTDLQTRYVGTTTLEVWGATDAADGASVEIRMSTAVRGRDRVMVVPSAGGHFYASARLPWAMRGRRVSVEARIAR